MNPNHLSVADAARKLGVSDARVRALIAAGRLRAVKVGGRWLVDPVSIDRRRIRVAPVGRPLGVANAWGLLWLASGERPHWLSPWALSRGRRRLREQGILSQVPRLGARAVSRRFRAHPSDVRRIAAERLVVKTGISASQDLDLALVAPGQAEAYVRERDWPAFAAKYALQEGGATTNVVLRIVGGLWPFAQLQHVAPVAVVGVDLATSDDPRTAREGRALLEELEERWSI